MRLKNGDWVVYKEKRNGKTEEIVYLVIEAQYKGGDKELVWTTMFDLTLNRNFTIIMQEDHYRLATEVEVKKAKLKNIFNLFYKKT
jgi:hypothetical protein